VKRKVVPNAKLCVLQQNATPNVLPQNPVATLFAKKPNAIGSVANQLRVQNQNAIFNVKDLRVNPERNLLQFVAPVIRLMPDLLLLGRLTLQLTKRYCHPFWRLCIALNYKLLKVNNHAVLAVHAPLIIKKFYVRQ